MRYTLLIFAMFIASRAFGEEPEFQKVQEWDANEARQAVAVDETHFYAISNSIIAKYERSTGKRVAEWKADSERPLVHLNSGIVIDGRLYCAHSNYPQFPEASSIEVFDTQTLKHIESKSLGIFEGSLTWIDRRGDSWWAVFAHYSKKVNDNPRAKDHTHTSLVEFDLEWRRKGGYVFPKDVLDRFDPHSCSGGSWGRPLRLGRGNESPAVSAPENSIWCSGHDLGEIYELQLPKAGSTLVLKQTWKAPITGQGFAWAPDGKSIFGINRPEGRVVQAVLKEGRSNLSPSR